MYFWDEKFSQEGYIYGEQPNKYFKSVIDSLEPGKLLLPGEGEGRNAVYAAKKGWDVHAFDLSEVGKKKAMYLAKKQGAEINYEISSVNDFDTDEKYDLIFLCFLHLLENERIYFHNKLPDFLKNDGIVSMQMFTKEQINRETGGPKNLEMLYEEEMLERDFSGLKILENEHKVEVLDEGPYHSGEADVINFKAVKE